MGPNLRAMDSGSPTPHDPQRPPAQVPAPGSEPQSPPADAPAPSDPPGTDAAHRTTEGPLDPDEFFFPPKRRPGPGCLGRGGCGIGCLSAMLVMLIALGGLMAWLVGEARLPAAESLVGPETVSFSIVHLDDEDPGIRALLDNSMLALRATFIDRSTLPASLKEILRKVAPEKVQGCLPIQVVITHDLLSVDSGTPTSAPSLSPPSPSGSAAAPSPASSAARPSAPLSPAASPSPNARGAAVPTVVISFGRFKGMPEFVFRAVAWSREEGAQLLGYRGFEILIVPPVHPGDVSCIGRLRNNYIFSSRLEGVKLAMDRLLSGSGAFGGRPEMGRMYADLDAHQDLLGVISSDGDQLRRFVSDIERAQDPNGPRLVPQGIDAVLAEVRQVGWEIDVLSQDEFTLHLRVDCSDERAAASIVHVLDEIGRDVKAAKLGEPMAAPHASGRLVDVAWRVHNLLPEGH